MKSKPPEIIVTVEAVLMSLIDGAPHIALIPRAKAPFSGEWALPGGRVRPADDVDGQAAIARVLRKKVGIEVRGLRPLASFSGRQRDPRGWSLAMSYLGLVPVHSISASGKSPVRWAHIDTLAALPFDHAAIVAVAIDQVRTACAQSALPLLWMPEKFTLSQLQSVYESVLGGPIDRRNFRRWIAEFDAIEPLAQHTRGGVQRPAMLYRAKPSALLAPALADRLLRLSVG